MCIRDRPLAVQIGETLFALRLVEAQSIAVTIPETRPAFTEA